MPVVDIPDIGSVEFPEEMSHEDIAAAAHGLYQQRQSEGVLRSAPSAYERVKGELTRTLRDTVPKTAGQALLTPLDVGLLPFRAGMAVKRGLFPEDMRPPVKPEHVGATTEDFDRLVPPWTGQTTRELGLPQKAGDVTGAALNQARNLARFFTTPEGVATVASGGVLGAAGAGEAALAEFGRRVIAGGFAADIGTSLPGQLDQSREVLGDKDAAFFDQAEAVAGPVFSTALLGSLAKHALTKGKVESGELKVERGTELPPMLPKTVENGELRVERPEVPRDPQPSTPELSTPEEAPPRAPRDTGGITGEGGQRRKLRLTQVDEFNAQPPEVRDRLGADADTLTVENFPERLKAARKELGLDEAPPAPESKAPESSVPPVDPQPSTLNPQPSADPLAEETARIEAARLKNKAEVEAYEAQKLAEGRGLPPTIEPETPNVQPGAEPARVFGGEAALGALARLRARAARAAAPAAIVPERKTVTVDPAEAEANRQYREEQARVEVERLRAANAAREPEAPRRWDPPRAEAVAPVPLESPEYGFTFRDAYADAGGLTGPDLDASLAALRKGRKPGEIVAEFDPGGEHDALGSILEEIAAARDEKRLSDYNRLRKAYQRTFGAGNPRADQTLEGLRGAAEQGLAPPGGVPGDEGELITRAWEEAARPARDIDRAATAAAQDAADFEAFYASLSLRDGVIYSGEQPLGTVRADRRGNPMLLPAPEAETLPPEYQRALMAAAGMEVEHGMDAQGGLSGFGSARPETLDRAVLADLTTLAGSIIEGGRVDFPGYAREMGRQLENQFQEYYHAAYNQVREFTEAAHLKARLTPRTEIENYDSTGQRQQPGAAGGGSELSGAVGGAGRVRRPGLRVVDEGDLPAPRPLVRSGEYTGPAGHGLDETQRYALNLALTAFEQGKPAFLLGDGTGVGKTGTELALAHQSHLKTGLPSLIVTQSRALIENRFKGDQIKLGIPSRGTQFLTYTDLSLGKVPKEEFGVVIFDEAHNLKRAGSNRQFHGELVKARHKVFATATPMDSPTHAAYFMAQLTGKTRDQLAARLGYHFEEQMTAQGPREFAVLDKDTDWGQVIDRLRDLRTLAVRGGQFIRREYPFFGRAAMREAPGFSAEQLLEQREIEKYWDTRIAGTRSPQMRRNLSGQKTGELSRWAEIQKLPHITEAVIEDLAAGKHVVVFAEGYRPTFLKGAGKTVGGFLGALGEELDRRGIPYAKVFEDSSLEKAAAAEAFQKGKARVLLATPRSGGAGLDMDDQTGHAPRQAHAATLNFAADVFDQMLGRVSRRNTASPAEFHVWSHRESFADRRRIAIADHKLRVLRNIQAGRDLDMSEFERTATAERGMDMGGEFSFDLPEGVGEQQARAGREAERAALQQARAELARKAGRPLTGGTGDLGQGDFLGGGDLFAPKVKRGEHNMDESTPARFAGREGELDGAAVVLYGKPYDSLTPYEQGNIQVTLEANDVHTALPRRQPAAKPAGRGAGADRGQAGGAVSAPAGPLSSASAPARAVAELRAAWERAVSRQGTLGGRLEVDKARHRLGVAWQEMRRDALTVAIEALEVRQETVSPHAAAALAKVRNAAGELNLKAFRNLPAADLNAVFHLASLQHAEADARSQVGNLSTIIYPGAETLVLRRMERAVLSREGAEPRSTPAGRVLADNRRIKAAAGLEQTRARLAQLTAELEAEGKAKPEGEHNMDVGAMSADEKYSASLDQLKAQAQEANASRRRESYEERDSLFLAGVDPLLSLARVQGVKAELQMAGTGSKYLILEVPTDFNADGEATNYETRKYRIANHEASVFREKQFGRNTGERIIGDGRKEQEAAGEWVVSKIVQAAEDAYGNQPKTHPWDVGNDYHLENADAALASGAAGIKTRLESEADKGGVAALQPGRASALTGANSPEAAGSVKGEVEHGFSGNTTLVKAAAEDVAAIRNLVAPQTAGGPARFAGNLLRELNAKLANELARADVALRKFRQDFDRTPVNTKKFKYDPTLPLPRNLAFIDAYESGDVSALSKLDQTAAAEFHRLNQADVARVHALGTGALTTFYANYFPHIWEDPKAAAAVFGKILGHAPIEGPKSFLKQRTYQLFKEGLAAGLKPVHDNPVDLWLLKKREVERYILAHNFTTEMKAAGLMKFKYAFAKTPDGWRTVDDSAFSVYGPPTVTVKEAFDAGMRQATLDVLKNLGVPHERLVKIGGAGRWGYERETPGVPGSERIVSKFAGPEFVIWHELGHVLHNRYADLEPTLTATDTLRGELVRLADARTDRSSGAAFKRNVRTMPEKMAVVLQAYLHAPDEMQRLAPTVKLAFDSFLNAHPELAQIRDIRPSLRLGVGEAELTHGGLLKLGDYVMPEAAANVVNNFLSPGLNPHLWYRTLRQTSNLLNGVQLGLSAFHLGFTSLDAATSRLAVAMEDAVRGKFGKALATAATVPVSPVTNIRTGAKLRAEVLTPGAHPEMAALAKALEQAGGRVGQDAFWQTEFTRRMTRAWHEGGLQWATLPLRAPLALWEQSMRPILEYIVPRQKLGVFADMAQRELEALGSSADAATTREALRKAWDSVDNRMGQVVYDNLFYNRSVKDVALLAFRAYGWQLGKYREGLGALGDTAGAAASVARGERPEFTHRMAYAMALPIMVGTIGGMMHYLMTGQQPQTGQDYFQPQTGEQDRLGNPVRLNLPSYVKDALAYAKHPITSFGHSLNPLLSSMFDLFSNRDFYNVEIRHPDDPLTKQGGDVALFAAKQFVPFSVSGQRKLAEEHAPLRKQLLPFFGVTPVPSRMTMTPAQELAAEVMHQHAPNAAMTQEQFDKGKLLKEIAAGMKAGEPGAAGRLAGQNISPGAMQTMIERLRYTPLQFQVQHMGAADAMRVWRIANPAERGQIQPIVASKLVGSTTLAPDLKAKLVRELLGR